MEVFVLIHPYFYSMLLHSPTQLLHAPQKIVSLVPSQTELLFDLGLDERVTGITKFCVHPPGWKKTKMIIGGTKNIHVEKIKAIAPDLVIANKEENVKEQVEQLAQYFNVWVTDVFDLESALQMIGDIGHLTQTSNKTTQLIGGIKQGFENLTRPPQNIKTCYLIWRQPYITIGGDTFISDMMLKCGLENIYATEKRYPEVDITSLREKGGELMILSSEPYPFKQEHKNELQQLLPGVKIIFADGEMFSWYGSRLLHSPVYFQKLISII
ncbi:MAG: helical backbone metal receptor [Ferruginibacter sp.]